MTFIKYAFIVGKNGHGADGVAVSDEGNAAETAALANRIDAEFFDFIDIIFANQDRLARSNDELGEVVPGGAGATRHAIATDDFHLKAKFVVKRGELGDIEIFDVEEAPQLFPNLFGELFF